MCAAQGEAGAAGMTCSLLEEMACVHAPVASSPPPQCPPLSSQREHSGTCGRFGMNFFLFELRAVAPAAATAAAVDGDGEVGAQPEAATAGVAGE